MKFLKPIRDNCGERYPCFVLCYFLLHFFDFMKTCHQLTNMLSFCSLLTSPVAKPLSPRSSEEAYIKDNGCSYLQTLAYISAFLPTIHSNTLLDMMLSS